MERYESKQMKTKLRRVLPNATHIHQTDRKGRIEFSLRLRTSPGIIGLDVAFSNQIYPKRPVPYMSDSPRSLTIKLQSTNS